MNATTSGDDQNGHAKVDELVIRYDRAADRMEIGGHVNSIDLMLDMLARATRTLEKQKRAAEIVELQTKLAEQARVNALVDSVRRGG